MDGICIIDYKAGNAPSVHNALERIGVKGFLASCPSMATNSNGVILPGVGTAASTMQSLKESGWIDFLASRVLHGNLPFLGICVGMQILFDYSEEGNTKCLGFLRGEVKRFDSGLRVPQMGWNKCQFASHRLFDGLGESDYFYFVNSYYCKPEENVAIATTSYGKDFCSMLAFNNIFASQCHLEKSGESGLRILSNFAREAGMLC